MLLEIAHILLIVRSKGEYQYMIGIVILVVMAEVPMERM